MSRNIDLTQPLSDEDRQYLVDRARHDDIRFADEVAEGKRDADEGISPALPAAATGTAQSASTTSPDAVPAADGAQTAAQAPTGDQPVNPAQGAQSGDQTGDPAPWDDEEAWSYSDIQEEVRNRREEDGDDYDGPALNSSREDLVAWLDADDAKNA